MDAFGRLRVSNCFTTFDYYPSLITENSSLITENSSLDIDNWVNITGGDASSSYNSNNYIIPNTYNCCTIKN